MVEGGLCDLIFETLFQSYEDDRRETMIRIPKGNFLDIHTYILLLLYF